MPRTVPATPRPASASSRSSLRAGSASTSGPGSYARPMRARSAWDRKGSADAYERGRPEYLAEAVAWAAERAGLLADGRALDLAAGTGRLTRALQPITRHVVAVEPGADMRAEIPRRSPGVEVLDGTAEAIPLADGSVDAVFVGDAFHWFDGERALTEIGRVLRDP